MRPGLRVAAGVVALVLGGIVLVAGLAWLTTKFPPNDPLLVRNVSCDVQWIAVGAQECRASCDSPKWSATCWGGQAHVVCGCDYFDLGKIPVPRGKR